MGERRFMIRTYLVLAGGVMIVALLLDLAFSRLQDDNGAARDVWRDAVFQLAESRLSAAPALERADVANRLERELGVRVQWLDASALSAKPQPGVQTLTADDGGTFYLKSLSQLQGVIRLGPVHESTASPWVRFLPALFYLSILVVVGLWLRPLLRDIRVLTTASQQFASDYREPISTAGNVSQLTSLAGNLDEMSLRLSQLLQSQKEMTAALSHEMRTPLARIRFALAVIGNDANTNVQRQLEDINADVSQIDSLIANLLDYARLDHPDVRMDWREVEFDPWLRQVVAAAGSRDRNVQLIGEVSGSVRLESKLMGLAISNLVSNACRYARREVRVCISSDADTVQVTVADDGPGIPEERRAEVFKAFTRFNDGGNTNTRGFGLGLAIVARVAALHAGQAIASSSEQLGGAEIILRWPKLVGGTGFEPVTPAV